MWWRFIPSNYTHSDLELILVHMFIAIEGSLAIRSDSSLPRHGLASYQGIYLLPLQVWKFFLPFLNISRFFTQWPSHAVSPTCPLVQKFLPTAVYL